MFKYYERDQASFYFSTTTNIILDYNLLRYSFFLNLSVSFIVMVFNKSHISSLESNEEVD